MLEEYDIKSLKPRKNPYAKTSGKQIVLDIDSDTIDYFKALSDKLGIPCKSLISLYLTDCAKNKRSLPEASE